jgi:hypothetical protein
MGGAGQALYLKETTVSSDPHLKKSSALKIFGSNLVLKDRRIVVAPISPYASLREAREKISENNFSSILESLYVVVMTHFTKNI